MNSLHVNPTTGEVFLRLPAPHENIIITPARESDTDALVLLLNDPRIYKSLLTPPLPYLPHHAEEWMKMTRNKSDGILERLREDEAVVDGCPVQYIREMQPDGTDLLLGDISVSRYRWLEVENEEVRSEMVRENSRKPAGDHTIVWTIGDYLRPSHHGKGIMSAAVDTVINQWMIPRMNAYKIRTVAIDGNIGSVRVFEKNGFKLLKTVKVNQDGSGCGRVNGVHLLEWERRLDSSDGIA